MSYWKDLTADVAELIAQTEAANKVPGKDRLTQKQWQKLFDDVERVLAAYFEVKRRRNEKSEEQEYWTEIAAGEHK